MIAIVVVGCGGAESAEVVAPAAPKPAVAAVPACGAGVPRAACDAAAAVRRCEPGARDRIGEWRYALIGGPFEPAQELAAARLAEAWRAGAIAATADTAAALAPGLGARGASPLLADGERPSLAAGRWTIVPAHELLPSWSVIAVDGRHPLAPEAAAPLAVELCGAARPAAIRNIDPAHVTTLVMSGTTALTGRTAERIDDTGATDTVRHIQPFFRAADLVHISNEVSFVRRCDPTDGQRELVFCARDRYIDVLEALNTRLVELTGSHLVDHGTRSLLRTIEQYERRGWIWFGGGRTQLDATAPRLLEHHGNKLAFVGCNAVASWIRAIATGPGVAGCDWARMTWQIQDLRRRGYTPIATVQHRELRTHAPPPDLVRDLRRLAEAGAAFVLGSQAHVAHPWDVHHGAYLHYGPGNLLFAQYREEQREASVDKLYIHEGKLLAVAHLYTRTEHGQPRLLSDAERARFLGRLAAAAASLAPPSPWVVPALPPEARTRPDSVAVGGRNQALTVTVPERLAADTRYSLRVDLDGTAVAAADEFLVVPAPGSRATTEEIAAFMRAKYPIDPSRITLPPPSSSSRRESATRRSRRRR